MAAKKNKAARITGGIVALVAVIGVLLVALSLLFTPKDNSEAAGMYDAPRMDAGTLEANFAEWLEK